MKLNISRREKWLLFSISICIFALMAVLLTTEEEMPEDEWESMLNESHETAAETVAGEEGTESGKLLMIDVKGAVNKPGVYELQEGKRVIDAISLAAGMREDADQNGVNLAMQLEDEMVIHIPEKGGGDILPAASAVQNDGKINVNKATADELQKLPGVGPSKADAILSYREEHGPFKTAEDLLNVPGIGAKSLEKLTEQIVMR